MPTLVNSYLLVGPWLILSPQMMSTAYKNELRKFDLERVLPAWDGLLSNQQTALASLGVPTMFATTAKAMREVRTCRRLAHPLFISFLFAAPAKGDAGAGRALVTRILDATRYFPIELLPIKGAQYNFQDSVLKLHVRTHSKVLSRIERRREVSTVSSVPFRYCSRY